VAQFTCAFATPGKLASNIAMTLLLQYVMRHCGLLMVASLPTKLAKIP
jgi:hypothetical protein